jgi:hypothetical protein
MCQWLVARLRGCVHAGGEVLLFAPFRSALRSSLGDVDSRQ